ncbi:pseudouridine-5'-phosphate glycosidase, partial [Streptomyces sp. NPDC005904]
MLVVSDEVRAAVARRRAVVALESTIIAHGLPRPRNLQVAKELEAAV